MSTSIQNDTLMKNCFKDWSQSNTFLRADNKALIRGSCMQRLVCTFIVCMQQNQVSSLHDPTLHILLSCTARALLTLFLN